MDPNTVWEGIWPSYPNYFLRRHLDPYMYIYKNIYIYICVCVFVFVMSLSRSRRHWPHPAWAKQMPHTAPFFTELNMFVNFGLPQQVSKTIGSHRQTPSSCRYRLTEAVTCWMCVILHTPCHYIDERVNAYRGMHFRYFAKPTCPAKGSGGHM